ncbi:hypothetical protein QFC21_004360 [Naganishia friedmannii]|uniref:Uncharacterized protein n=1 Tax=Naganishia friedmannii TaxID=89922 RepID=A0ACC2VIE9_9TREE|nr:hypothetical protein QFC21_004360 [Naganishia friedmannii]
MLDSYLVQCQHILKAVIASSDNGRGVAGEFMALPDRKAAPNYYAVIPEPICLNMISDRLKKKNHYKHPEDFMKDLHLVFLNAKYYNKEKSTIWKDAAMLEKQLLPEVKDETLAENLDPPRTKGRPPKNPLIDQYRIDHPDITAVMDPKPPKAKVLKSSSPLTGLSATVSAEKPVSEAPPVTLAPGTSTLTVPAQAAFQNTGGSQAGASPQLTNAQVTSLNNFPTPSRTQHAAGQSRLIAPPPPVTFPKVEIPEHIPGLEEQEFTTIADHARLREELDMSLEKRQGPAENITPEVNDEGNRIPGSGWWGDEYGGYLANWQQLAMDIIEKLRMYIDADGNRPASAIEQLPVASNIQYLSFKIIATNLMNNVYRTMKAFDMEMTRLFEKARRYYQRVTPPYGHVLAVQRLYNALTSMYETQEIGDVTPPPPSPLSYASVPAGPGNAKPMGDNGVRNSETKEFTSFRVATKDRSFTNMAKYKGMTYKIGRYSAESGAGNRILIYFDPRRGLCAYNQSGGLFKAYSGTGLPVVHSERSTTTTYGYSMLVLQTRTDFAQKIVHLPTHLFYEDEVFKTGHMVDHPVEDIMERVGCQFFTKRETSLSCGFILPTDVCVARYNEKEHLTVRIKNWNSCIPEPALQELRKSDFMQVSTFDKAPHTLRLYKSPFLTGTQPGTRGVTGFLSDVVGQTPSEKKGVRGDSATGDDEAQPGGSTPNPSSERAAKKARTEERSPMIAAAIPQGHEEQKSELPALIIGASPTAPSPAGLPATSHIQGFSAASVPRQLAGTAPTPAYSSSMHNRVPATQPSPFSGPHSIVPLNRSNPVPFQPQMMNNLPNLQPPRPINLPAASQPRPGQGYSHAPGGFTMNTQSIKPISNTQQPLQYHSQPSGQGVPARSQLPTHAHAQAQSQSSGPQAMQLDGRPTIANVTAPRGVDKSLAVLYGGPQELARLCDTETLPESTVNLLDRDPVTNRVLWFSGPPIHVDVPEKPTHSAAYLAYLAQKRLRFALGGDASADVAARDVEMAGPDTECDKEREKWATVDEEVTQFLNARS